MKYPDACFLFEDPETLQTTPMVIFDSEKYPDLLGDTRILGLIEAWLIDCLDASISETEVAGGKDLYVHRLLIISLLGSMYYIQILYLLLGAVDPGVQ